MARQIVLIYLCSCLSLISCLPRIDEELARLNQAKRVIDNYLKQNAPTGDLYANLRKLKAWQPELGSSSVYRYVSDLVDDIVKSLESRVNESMCSEGIPPGLKELVTAGDDVMNNPKTRTDQIVHLFLGKFVEKCSATFERDVKTLVDGSKLYPLAHIFYHLENEESGFYSRDFFDRANELPEKLDAINNQEQLVYILGHLREESRRTPDRTSLWVKHNEMSAKYVDTLAVKKIITRHFINPCDTFADNAFDFFSRALPAFDYKQRNGLIEDYDDNFETVKRAYLTFTMCSYFVDQPMQDLVAKIGGLIMKGL